jgi:hypothetical protein
MSSNQSDIPALPPNNFNPSGVHTDSAADITDWLNRFRSRVDPSFGTYIDIIRLEEERPWLETLRNSSEKFLGNMEIDDWDEIQPADAIEELGKKLHKSMAYNVELMDEEVASNWARSFVESLTSSAEGCGVTWHTNLGPSGGWNPVTSSTFDFCVVGVSTSSKYVGYVLVTDED